MAGSRQLEGPRIVIAHPVGVGGSRELEVQLRHERNGIGFDGAGNDHLISEVVVHLQEPGNAGVALFRLNSHDAGHGVEYSVDKIHTHACRVNALKSPGR